MQLDQRQFLARNKECATISEGEKVKHIFKDKYIHH